MQIAQHRGERTEGQFSVNCGLQCGGGGGGAERSGGVGGMGEAGDGHEAEEQVSHACGGPHRKGLRLR